MKKYLPLVGLVVVAACTPDIAEDSAPTGEIIAEFDPANSVIPTPNDLIPKVDGHLAIPDQPGDSEAQKQFNREYLNTLDNFPAASTATAHTSGELNPATVTAQNVLVIDITNPQLPVPVAVKPAYANKQISVAPPEGGWTRGHQYAVALLAGETGLRGANNEVVIGSPTWSLVSSTTPLVSCTDQATLSGDCKPTVDIIPTTKSGFADQLVDQTAKAKQLEQIRLAYAPLLDKLQGLLGKSRSDVPLGWTFTIADAAEVTFDPATSTIPFPNDVVRTGPGGTVALPSPATGKVPTAAECAAAKDTATLLICGLNTLDGFSTLVPPVSENSPTRGAVSAGSLIDEKTLDTKTVGLVPVASTAPDAERTAPSYTPCINCVSSQPVMGTTVPVQPQQLQWKLNAPLDEKTTYLGYVTNGVKDDKGKAVVPSPTFALLRSTSPLSVGGKTQVTLLTDPQSAQLEQLRLALAPAFAGLEKAGVPRTSVTLAFPFTTQSEATVLDQLYTVPAQAKAMGLPDYPLVTRDATATYTGAAGASGIPIGNVGKFYAGQFLSPLGITGASGTFNPGLTGAKPQPINFAMAVPSAPAPAGGYPVTIFGHGFTGNRNNFLAIANALTGAGQVVIASDVLFHGDRTSCTGSKSATGAASDDASCADPTIMKCDEGTYGSTTNFGQGLCVLRDDAVRAACAPSPTDPLGDGVCAVAGQGRCAADGKCQGANAGFLAGGTGAPAISGWNIFNFSNFFATRDNLRQQVIDLSQLTSILKSTDPKKLGNQVAAVNGGTPLNLDPTKINYVGQSLGGIQGTLFNAVSPDTQNVVLNVPGGALVSIILTAPSFAAQKQALYDTLAGQGLLPGTAAFDQFIGFAQWIIDPADPANMGYRLTHPADAGNGVTSPSPTRKAFIQFIEGDETVPNGSNFALVAAANRTFNPAAPPSFGCQAPLFCYEFTEAGDGFDKTTVPTNKRHPFLLVPPAATAVGVGLTTKAQTQAATFVATGNFQ
ncbi:MAG: Lipase-like protein [Labilithrix sp.]|nr:Lipase-like protein [Labilithrix sp.]